MKRKLERDYQSSFVKSSGSKRTKVYNTIHCYSCNRSGSHVNKTRGKRQIKSHETLKIGHHCIAQLSVTVDNCTAQFQ